MGLYRNSDMMFNIHGGMGMNKFRSTRTKCCVHGYGTMCGSSMFVVGGRSILNTVLLSCRQNRLPRWQTTRLYYVAYGSCDDTCFPSKSWWPYFIDHSFDNKRFLGEYTDSPSIEENGGYDTIRNSLLHWFCSLKQFKCSSRFVKSIKIFIKTLF